MVELFNDPVVAEVHATRAAMLAAAGGDAEALMRQVADRQRQSARRIICRPIIVKDVSRVASTSATDSVGDDARAD